MTIAKEETKRVTVQAFAYVVAAIAFRRGMYGKESRLALQHLSDLHSSPWPHGDALCLHLESLTYSAGSVDDLRRGWRLSTKANAACPDSPGIQHALAEFQLELAIWDAKSDKDREASLEAAADLVGQAIDGQGDSEPWAKFYFTRARIELRMAKTRDQFRNAMNELDKAIGLEAKKTVDSGERRARYQFEKTLAEMRLEIEELAIETEQRVDQEIQKQSRRSQIQVIGAVGFLTSLLAILQFAAALFVAANAAASAPDGAFWYLLVAILVVACILFSSVAIAVRYLSRQGA